MPTISYLCFTCFISRLESRGELLKASSARIQSEVEEIRLGSLPNFDAARAGLCQTRRAFNWGGNVPKYRSRWLAGRGLVFEVSQVCANVVTQFGQSAPHIFPVRTKLSRPLGLVGVERRVIVHH